MRIARLIVNWLGILVIAFCMIAAAGFVFAQTSAGRAVLARAISSLASRDGLTVDVEDITGFVPTDMRVGRVTLSDAGGPFGAVEGLQLVWRPLALLTARRLDVAELSAERVQLDRRPVLPPAPPATGGGGATIPLLPVRVGSFAIDEIALGESVVGMSARLSVQASAELVDASRGLSLAFNVKRLDAPGELRGRASYAPADGSRLALDVTASEPAGGLVARLAQIDGLPAIALTVKGDAPLDDWNGTLAFDASSAGRISGTAALKAVEGGRRLSLDLGGSVGGLVPARIAPLFAGGTELIGSAIYGADGRLTIEGLNLSAAGFGLALLGSLDTAAKTADLTVDLVGGDAAHFASLASGIGWKEWRLNARLTGALTLPAIDAKLSAEGLSGKGYGAAKLALAVRGTPKAGALMLDASGTLDGLSADEPKIVAALGSSARFSASGSIGDGLAALTAASLSLAPLDAAFSGSAGADAVKGRLTLTRLDLAAFSGFANRPLSGVVAFSGSVDTGDAFSALALDVSGTATKVTLGVDKLDGFLVGETRFQGGVRRAADGTIAVKNFTLVANGLDLAVDGGIARETADLSARLSLADLGRLDPRVKGTARADLHVTGGLDALGLAGRFEVPSAEAMGKPIRGLVVTADLADLTGRPSGTVTLDGRIADRPARGTARLVTEADRRRIDDLHLAVGSVTVAGALGIGGDGILGGTLTVAAADLSDLSPLILMDIGGRIDAKIVLDRSGALQRVAATGRAQNIVFAGSRLESADIDARVVDPMGTPVLDGRVDLAGLDVGGERIERASVTARANGTSSNVTLDTALRGAAVTANAMIAPANGGTRIRLDALRVARDTTAVTLAAPAAITLAGGDVVIDRLQLASGGGSATIAGRAGSQLDLRLDINNLPLALAGLVSPSIDARGTLSGTARVAGTASAPSGNYDLRVAGLSTSDLAMKGIGPFAVTARGDLAGGRVTVDAAVTAPSISGLTIRGSAPMGPGALDLRVAGGVDLAIANSFLADGGVTMRGRADIDVALRGTAAAPDVAGTVRLSGGRFIDSVNGVVLTDIRAVLTGSNQSLVISELSANTPQQGRLSGSGQITIDPAGGFPASIRVRMDRAAIISTSLMQLVANGDITVDGPLATRPRIAGRIDVLRLDINLADKLPGGGMDPLLVRHINTGGKVLPAQKGLRAQAQARAAGRAQRASTQTAFVADLDLTIAAANAVFVRGMGIDAEFAGSLTLRGTTANLVTLGGFELRRGRFDVLGRRLDFTQGKITFEGNTDPALDFVASTSTSDVTASIIVGGRASAPAISFTSTPALAQDEVLARLLFGRSVSTLNASQALQVAQAIAQFSGGGPGVLDEVRRSLGVDSFDVDASGNVGIGKRLSDRVYIGARQGLGAGVGKVTVDVDLTRNIRLQGAVGGSGEGQLGVGAQWDY